MREKTLAAFQRKDPEGSLHRRCQVDDQSSAFALTHFPERRSNLIPSCVASSFQRRRLSSTYGFESARQNGCRDADSFPGDPQRPAAGLVGGVRTQTRFNQASKLQTQSKKNNHHPDDFNSLAALMASPHPPHHHPQTSDHSLPAWERRWRVSLAPSVHSRTRQPLSTSDVTDPPPDRDRRTTTEEEPMLAGSTSSSQSVRVSDCWLKDLKGSFPDTSPCYACTSRPTGPDAHYQRKPELWRRDSNQLRVQTTRERASIVLNAAAERRRPSSARGCNSTRPSNPTLPRFWTAAAATGASAVPRLRSEAQKQSTSTAQLTETQTEG